jgi:predicted Rossmann fold nucleotide-binding protein DprA/Smf involved in DNA uptake
MGVGQSGRIVVELDPALKRRLHERLRNEGRDFKGWLLERVEQYLATPRTSAAPQDNVDSLDGEGPRGGGASPDFERAPSGLSELEERVLEAVSSAGRADHHVDDLVHATGLGIGQIQAVLLELELRGFVARHLGLYRRVGHRAVLATARGGQ